MLRISVLCFQEIFKIVCFSQLSVRLRSILSQILQPCSSYLEQQPSTSTVVAHPVSSIPSATAHSTPRSSSAIGVESSVERVAKQVSFHVFLWFSLNKSIGKTADFALPSQTLIGNS